METESLDDSLASLWHSLTLDEKKEILVKVSAKLSEFGAKKETEHRPCFVRGILYSNIVTE